MCLQCLSWNCKLNTHGAENNSISRSNNCAVTSIVYLIYCYGRDINFNENFYSEFDDKTANEKVLLEIHTHIK